MSGAQEKSSAVARYRLLRELGHRSQRTWAAVRSDGSNALVVINRYSRDARLETERVSAEAMAIIHRDARCLARNWHPNITRVRHVDISGDTLYVATEMLDGVTLEDLLVLARERAAGAGGSESVGESGAPLSHAVLARIFLDILSGLHALHSLRDGISTPLDAYHGELCPANVVVGKDGITRIIDPFRPRPVTVGPQSEALGYASPETLAGESGQDARVDIYAAGVMLWEALMDRRLYDDPDPVRIAHRQREEDVPRPTSPLGDVAMKAMAFDPLLRWRSANEMAAAIRACAGTIAPGATVAQIVLDLAGDRIRARRAELHPGGSGERPAVKAPMPERRQSGALPRVSIASNNVVEEVIAPSSVQRRDDSASLMTFAKRAAVLEGGFTKGAGAEPKSEARGSSRNIPDAMPTARQLDLSTSTEAPTPYAPPVRPKPAGPATAGPARVRKVVSLERRTSEPDLEASHAARPKSPRPAPPSSSAQRIVRRPVTNAPLLFDRPPPSREETSHDDLPGPRQSIPHEQAAALLEEARRLESSIPPKAAPVRDEDAIPSLDSDALLEDSGSEVEALAAAREIAVSRESLTPPAVEAAVVPAPLEGTTAEQRPEPGPLEGPRSEAAPRSASTLSLSLTPTPPAPAVVGPTPLEATQSEAASTEAASAEASSPESSGASSWKSPREAPPPPPLSLPSLDALTSTLTEPPRSHAFGGTRTPADVESSPSTRPLVSIDPAPSSEPSGPAPRRSALPFIAGIAALAIGVLFAGAAIISRRSADAAMASPPPMATEIEPPRTIVAPPPVEPPATNETTTSDAEPASQ